MHRSAPVELAGALIFACAAASSAQTAPCVSPAAVSLADRPGTGRATSTGGAPCVALPGEIVVESGWRAQETVFPAGTATLRSGPLGFVRIGVAKRLELGVAPPAPQSRQATGMTSSLDTARGTTDAVLALKYLVLDTGATQASLGAAYSPPSGTGEFTNGIPTYAVGLNVGTALNARLSFAASIMASTAAGADATGMTRSYFVFAPAFTLAYALDANDTVLVQDALISRQGLVSPAGSRGFIALQRALGSRLALDIDYEKNLAPQLGTGAHAFGGGVVWIAAPGHR